MTSLSKKNQAVVAKTARKRGRPLGSKNKPAARAKAFKHPNDVANLLKRIEELETIRDRLHKMIDHHEHKEIQYLAVIDYLETKLEIN